MRALCVRVQHSDTARVVVGTMAAPLLDSHDLSDLLMNDMALAPHTSSAIAAAPVWHAPVSAPAPAPAPAPSSLAALEARMAALEHDIAARAVRERFLMRLVANPTALAGGVVGLVRCASLQVFSSQDSHTRARLTAPAVGERGNDAAACGATAGAGCVCLRRTSTGCCSPFCNISGLGPASST